MNFWKKTTPKTLQELRVLVSEMCADAESCGYKPDEVFITSGLQSMMLSSERLTDGSQVVNLEMSAA